MVLCHDSDDRNIELSSHECEEGNSKWWYKLSSDFHHYRSGLRSRGGTTPMQ